MCYGTHVLKDLQIPKSYCYPNAQPPHPQMAQNRTRVSRHVPAEGRLVAA